MIGMTRFGMQFGREEALGQRNWEWLEKFLLLQKPTCLLEFGAGLSTLLFSDHTSVVTYEDWMPGITRLRNQMQEFKIPAERIEIHWWDGFNFTDEIKQYPLCFVDGPWFRQLRGSAIRIASKSSDFIFVHDSHYHQIALDCEKYLGSQFEIVDFQPFRRGIGGQGMTLWRRKK